MLIFNCCSVAQSCQTLCDCMDCSMPGFPSPWPSPRTCSNPCPMSWWCHPTISPFVLPFSSCPPLLLLPAVFPSIIVFSNESVLHIRWPKYWSFNFGISPSNEYLELISFRMDSFDLLAIQGTLRSLHQHHSSKASILRCSAFYMVQLSHPCVTAGKPIALTRQTFVSKVMSLLFNMLSRCIIAFLPRSKHLLISRLKSPSTVILEPKKIKSDTVSIVSPCICHEVMGQDAMICIFWNLNFKPAFSLSSFTFIKWLFSSSLLSAIRVVSSEVISRFYFLNSTSKWKHTVSVFLPPSPSMLLQMAKCH